MYCLQNFLLQLSSFSSQIVFYSKLMVEEQYRSYLFPEYIADIGGYVGIFLGFSLYDMSYLVVIVVSYINEKG